MLKNISTRSRRAIRSWRLDSTEHEVAAIAGAAAGAHAFHAGDMGRPARELGPAGPRYPRAPGPNGDHAAGDAQSRLRPVAATAAPATPAISLCNIAPAPSGFWFFWPAGSRLISFNLIQIQLVEHDKYWRMAIENHTHPEAIPPERGAFFDCDGNILAQTQRVYDIRLDGQELKRPSRDQSAQDRGAPADPGAEP